MNGEGGLPAASPRNNIVGREGSTARGREPARLELSYRPGEPIDVGIVAEDEEGEIEIRWALEQREVGLAVAAAVWRFAAQLGAIDELADFDPLDLLRLPARRRAS